MVVFVLLWRCRLPFLGCRWRLVASLSLLLLSSIDMIIQCHLCACARARVRARVRSVVCCVPLRSRARPFARISEPQTVRSRRRHCRRRDRCRSTEYLSPSSSSRNGRRWAAVPSTARRDLDVVVVVVVGVAGPLVPSSDATSFASPSIGRRCRGRLSSAPSSSFLGCRCCGRRGASVLRPPALRRCR